MARAGRERVPLMEEFAGAFKGGKYFLDPVHRRRFDKFGEKQKEGARYITRLVRESPQRELSQNNAHWERCTILAAECGASKEKVSDWLMEDAFNATRNVAFGEYITAFGRTEFLTGSTSQLTKHEFWELKRAAYKKLQFLNEERDPDNFAKFPERGANGLILRWCVMWEERPADDAENESPE